MKGRSLRSCLWEGNNVPKKIDILRVKVEPQQGARNTYVHTAQTIGPVDEDRG